MTNQKEKIRSHKTPVTQQKQHFPKWKKGSQAKKKKKRPGNTPSKLNHDI